MTRRFRLLRTLRAGERGQATVELALILPLILLILIGIVELGHAVNTWNNETNIAQTVARYAVVGEQPRASGCNGGKPEAAQSFAVCEAEQDGIPNATSLKVCISVPSAKVGEPVEVKVESEYPWLKYLPFKTASHVSGRATMRLEQVPPEITC